MVVRPALTKSYMQALMSMPDIQTRTLVKLDYPVTQSFWTFIVSIHLFYPLSENLLKRSILYSKSLTFVRKV